MTRGTRDHQRYRANPRMGLVPVDDNVVLVGTWGIDVRSTYPLLSIRDSSETGAHLKFTFQGRLIGLLYHKETDHGIANITVDGVAYDDIDMYAAAALAYNMKIIARNLTEGEHELRVTCSGTKNPASTDVKIVVSGFVVLDSSNPALCERVSVGIITPVWDGTRFRHLYAIDLTPDPDFIPQIGLVGWNGSDPYRILVDTAGHLITSPADHTYKHVTADTQVKGSAGKLHTVTVNECSVAGTLTLYDNTAESGTIIAAIAIPVTPTPFTLIYDVAFSTGLYAGFDGSLAADVTISYL